MGKTNGGSLLENLTLPSTHPTLHIVMLGLDSAGKTTALYRLKFDQYVNTVCFFKKSHICCPRNSNFFKMICRFQRLASIVRKSEPCQAKPRVLSF